VGRQLADDVGLPTGSRLTIAQAPQRWVGINCFLFAQLGYILQTWIPFARLYTNSHTLDTFSRKEKKLKK
jgi:hypothetical protein